MVCPGTLATGIESPQEKNTVSVHFMVNYCFSRTHIRM